MFDPWNSSDGKEKTEIKQKIIFTTTIKLYVNSLHINKMISYSGDHLRYLLKRLKSLSVIIVEVYFILSTLSNLIMNYK